MLAELEPRINDCMLADRPAFRRRLRKLRRRVNGQQVALERLAKDVERSAGRCARRRAGLPAPQYPPELPVSAERGRIAETIAAHQVTIVCGETGSGKTTQIPKICLELGRGVSGLIGHTQPRRIAARSVAARIATELGTELGRAVGYQVRFTGRVSPDAYVKLMTDGILLAEIQRDRLLNAYDTIIIDEAHERSLNVDFLLGYLKRLLPKRPDLKLIITSATIDPERFSRHFGDAPVLEVSGRSWPVQVRHRPTKHDEEEEQEQDLYDAIVESVDEARAEVPGDILVFLPGEREIRETASALRKRRYPHTELLPLYARLSASQQDEIFRPHAGRRVVLATNVAETSLTVPNIRAVIDPGYARLSRYSYRTKVQRLPIEKIARASADQRKGRCGRVGPGLCIRLYSEADYESRPAFTDPEILRTDLAAVILQMQALGLGEVSEFPFLDAPDRRFISDGYRLLRELGALDEVDGLTRIGKRLARMPLDPRIGRMILAAEEEGSLDEVLVIAAALSIPDPRENPMHARETATAALAGFRDERSDFMGLLNLWRGYREQARERSNNALRRWCREHFLSWMRMREWEDVQRQLSAIARELGLRRNRRAASYTRIHRALLAGLLGHIGFRANEREYDGARNTRFRISPSSALHGAGAKWVVAAELIETTQRYAYTVARVRPEWIEHAARHLVRRSHAGAYWDARRAAVWAYERVTLYGLTLTSGRRVPYAPVSSREAREVFIQAGLVEGGYESEAPFVIHNRALMTEIRALEHRTRRGDLLVDERSLFEFYAARIPEGITSGADFEAWWRGAKQDELAALCLSREALLRDASLGISSDFPDALVVQGQRLPLEYRFQPGDDADGITARVPVAVLNQLDPSRFEWLVPGMLREKVIALMRTLPKSLRRHFVPLPDVADACLETLAPCEGGLAEALARELQQRTGVAVPPDAWRADRLPGHLRMRFRVVDAGGVEVASGRDLARLQKQFGARAAQSFRRLPPTGFEREDVSGWDFGDLPEMIAFEETGVRYTGHPALVAEGGRVALRLLDTPAKAAAAHRGGLRRLFMRQIPQDLRHLRKNLPGIEQMCLAYVLVEARPGAGRRGAGDGQRKDACAELRDDLIGAIAERAFLDGGCEVRTAGEFERRVAQGRAALTAVADELCRAVARVLEEYRGVLGIRRRAFSAARAETFRDIDTQLAHLVYRGFVGHTPPGRLGELPRYLRAIALRIRKIERDPARDAACSLSLGGYWQRYLERRALHRERGIHDPELEAFRWMLEELRVSWFAQELGTAQPVSEKRLERQWARVKP